MTQSSQHPQSELSQGDAGSSGLSLSWQGVVEGTELSPGQQGDAEVELSPNRKRSAALEGQGSSTSKRLKLAPAVSPGKIMGYLVNSAQIHCETDHHKEMLQLFL